MQRELLKRNKTFKAKGIAFNFQQESSIQNSDSMYTETASPQKNQRPLCRVEVSGCKGEEMTESHS